LIHSPPIPTERLLRKFFFLKARCGLKLTHPRECLWRNQSGAKVSASGFSPLRNGYLRYRVLKSQNADQGAPEPLDIHKDYWFGRAASVFESHSDLDMPVEYYLKGRNHAASASLIQRIGLGLLKVCKDDELSRWLHQIPPSFVEEAPWLRFYSFTCKRFRKPGSLVMDLDKALKLFEDLHDLQGQLLSLALLIESTITKGNDAIPLYRLVSKYSSPQESVHYAASLRG
jgi:hypothetical protein